MKKVCKKKGSIDVHVICIESVAGVVMENWKDIYL